MAVRGLLKFRSAVLIGTKQLSPSLPVSCQVLSAQCSRLRISPPVASSSFIPVGAHHRLCNYSTSSYTKEVDVQYVNGIPVFSVPLPSRQEQCQFTLRPLSNSLSDLIAHIQNEDRGVERVAAYTIDGTRIAKSTSIDLLLQNDFELVINDDRYTITPPNTGYRLDEHLQDVSDLKNSIAKLYVALNVEQHQMLSQKDLQAKLEDLKTQLEPYERIHQDMIVKAKKRTNNLKWIGLGYMSLQFGFLARLTWWEYSWDIMEPVTYFITYGTSIIMYAYWVLTRQDFTYPDMYNREFLLTLHRHAKKDNLNINSYNKLQDDIALVEADLKRLRDPLQMQLPLEQLKIKKKDIDF